MKIGGVDPKLLPPEHVLVLPRNGGEIVLRARGLSDLDEFNKLCPEPSPPMMTTKEGPKTDLKDKGYLAQKANQQKRYWDYLVVKSLEPSTIEWDSVQLDNPSSWANWDADLKGAGFSSVERNRVFGLVLEANSLDERKLQKAREVFLRGSPQESPD